MNKKSYKKLGLALALLAFLFVCVSIASILGLDMGLHYSITGTLGVLLLGGATWCFHQLGKKRVRL